MYAYIARQPIFDHNKKVAGYELPYRDGTGGNAARIVDGDAATRDVLNDAIAVFGIPQLTNRLPAYINFTRNLLMDDFAYLAGPKEIVVEVPGDVMVDDLLVQKLNALKRAGYRLALGNYSEQNGRLKFDRIIQVFDVIRIDVMQNTRLQQKSLVSRLSAGRAHALLLASRVETLEDFATARSMGFSLFQGYFFEKPTFLSKSIPSLADSSYGRLFNELLRPNPNFDACVKVIQSDSMMTHMFLRRAQTVNLYRGATAAEIRRGLVLVGTEELRRWVSLVLLKQNNVTHSDETARKAYLRGRFIERLMENSDTDLDPRQGFLLGLFSLLDTVMGVRMESLIADLNLMPALKAALLGKEENEYSLFLQYAVIYEMANPRLILPDIRLRLNWDELSTLYMECIADKDEAFSGTGGTAE